MIGELIPTGVTFGTGRISVNDQFSGTAEFNDVEVSGNLSAGTGGVIYSGGTDLYNIFGSLSGNYLPLTITGITFVNVDDAALFFTGNTGTSITTAVVGGDSNSITQATFVSQAGAVLASLNTLTGDSFYVSSNQLNGASLEYNTGSTVHVFKVTKSAMRASSTIPTFPGITYGGDYSSNYTNRSLVDKEYVDIAVASGGGVNPYINLGTTGSTLINWDVSGSSTNYEVILSGDVGLTLTNVRNGEYGTIIVTQDSVGGRNLTFGTINGLAGVHKVVNGGGGAPTLTSTASATDILSFTYNGSTMYWTVGNDYT
jgi:predicted outer membrane repeat protein